MQKQQRTVKPRRIVRTTIGAMVIGIVVRDGNDEQKAMLRVQAAAVRHGWLRTLGGVA